MSSDNVVILPVETLLPIPVERVLDGARHLKYVLVLGWTEEGEFYAACSDGDMHAALFAATKFQHKLHAGDYDE